MKMYQVFRFHSKTALLIKQETGRRNFIPSSIFACSSVEYCNISMALLSTSLHQLSQSNSNFSNLTYDK
jgi:hypothetical protein